MAPEVVAASEAFDAIGAIEAVGAAPAGKGTSSGPVHQRSSVRSALSALLTVAIDAIEATV